MRKSTRVPWDAPRWAAVGLGLLMPVSVLVYPLIVGQQMFSGDPTPASTSATVAALIYPALLSGAVGGARYFGLYAGFAENHDATDPLDGPERERGNSMSRLLLGDWLWSSLVASVTGGAVLAFMTGQAQFDWIVGQVAFGLAVFLPIVFVVGLGWMLGAVIGSVVSLLLSTAAGAIFGAMRRRDRHGRFTWLAIGIFVLLLLITGASTALVVLPRGSPTFEAFAYLAGTPVPGAHFLLGPILLAVCRVALWLTAALFLLL
ncbi:MAG TPA: hypothetical protein VN759_12450, partial [Pseudolysinimonas sp.]|nr:hypothetical protein [Pseudolysinimonas sp.]